MAQGKSFNADMAWRLLAYDKLKGIGWEWQSVDGCMVKAPLAKGKESFSLQRGDAR
jgi:hypothetical protein